MLRAAVISSALWAASIAGAEITGARYGLPTDRYGHGAVEGGEYSAMEIRIAPDRVLGVALPEAVFEDTRPRLIDFNGDGNPEIVAVISFPNQGAAIRIYGEVAREDHPEGSSVALLAQNDPIGRHHRWLAIAGIGDLDGDGRIEIAYVDRPHLAKTLRLLEVRTEGDAWELVPEASLEGFTNHRYRAPDIEGGMRECGLGPELVLADAAWSKIKSVQWSGSAWRVLDLGPYDGVQSLQAALSC